MAVSVVVDEFLLRRRFAQVEGYAFAVAFLESRFKLVFVEDAYGYAVAPLLGLLQRGSFLLPVLAPVLYNGVETCFLQLVEAALRFALRVFAVLASVPVFSGYVVVCGTRLQALDESHAFMLNALLDDFLEVPDVVSVGTRRKRET